MFFNTFLSIISIQHISHIINYVIFPNIYLFLFLFILLEEMGVPMPIPGEFFLFLAGYSLSLGHVNLISIILVVLLSTFIGASILYSILYWKGLNFIEKYGRYIFMPKSRVLDVQEWFLSHGFVSILVGRWVFGLRILSNVIGGLFRFKYYKFMSTTLFATIIWTVFYLILGLFLGKYYPNLIAFLSQFNSVVIEIIYLILLTLITAFFIRIVIRGSQKNK